MTPTIAIIGALEKEVRQIYQEIEHGTVAEEAGLTIVGGEYHGFNLVATTAGMGTVNAAAATPVRARFNMPFITVLLFPPKRESFSEIWLALPCWIPNPSGKALDRRETFQPADWSGR